MQSAVRYVIVLALLGQFVPMASAMGFRCLLLPSFREWTEENNAVLVVQLQPDPKNLTKCQRDAVIIEIIRSRVPLLEGARTVPIDRPIPVLQPMQPRTMIVFGARANGQWDWYSGIDSDADAVRCVKGLFKLDPKDKLGLLRFSFDYLKSPNQEIASRALAEWNDATPVDVGRVARQLPAAQVRALVKDRKTPRHVRDMACFMLGHCGEEKDAALIRRHMESVEPSYGWTHRYDADPLKGYLLLKPKEAWAFVGALIRDPARHFADGYNALLAARYLYDHHPKLIEKQEVQQLFAHILHRDDFADFVIDDFRKWQCWDYTDRILALLESKPHDHPVVKSAILRYALRCPDPACIEFVAEQRRRDRQWVVDNEERIALEAAP